MCWTGVIACVGNVMEERFEVSHHHPLLADLFYLFRGLLSVEFIYPNTSTGVNVPL